MSIRVMSQIWDSGPSDRSELVVMLALADYANDDGECWPSMAGIAQKARMTERGAQKILRRLEETGWLKIETGGGRGGKNHYVIQAQNGELHSVNGEHRMKEKPRTAEHKPRTGVHKTPNTGSPEPSRTIKEPSIDKNVRDALCSVLRPETADAYIAHRKAKGAKITDKAAELIARKLSKHPNPDAVAEESIANGWTGVFPERVPKEQSQKPETDLDAIWKSLETGTHQ